jgi:tRNA threonylcarbamoyladenosine biosynthesis protein TsaB
MNDTASILAFDTSLGRCSAAVYNKNTKRTVSKYEDMERGHAEALIPLIEAVLAESGLAFDGLDAIAVPLGPGAFTGLRIGLSAAKALGLSLDIPVIGLETFTLLARQYFKAGALPAPYERLGILIETRRSDFYIRLFDSAGTPLGPPEALEGAEILERHGRSEIFWIGDAVPRFRDAADIPACFGFGNLFFPDPLILIESAGETLPTLPTRQYSGEVLEPLYLRGADVSAPKIKTRTLV